MRVLVSCPSCPALPKRATKLPPAVPESTRLEQIADAREARAPFDRDPLYRCPWCGSQFNAVRLP